MTLHNEIMNLPCGSKDMAKFAPSEHLAYKVGHRDARHAAAELSLKYEQEIENLRACALKYLSYLGVDNPTQALEQDLINSEMIGK